MIAGGKVSSRPGLLIVSRSRVLRETFAYGGYDARILRKVVYFTWGYTNHEQSRPFTLPGLQESFLGPRVRLFRLTVAALRRAPYGAPLFVVWNVLAPCHAPKQEGEADRGPVARSRQKGIAVSIGPDTSVPEIVKKHASHVIARWVVSQPLVETAAFRDLAMLMEIRDLVQGLIELKKDIPTSSFRDAAARKLHRRKLESDHKISITLNAATCATAMLHEAVLDLQRQLRTLASQINCDIAEREHG